MTTQCAVTAGAVADAGSWHYEAGATKLSTDSTAFQAPAAVVHNNIQRFMVQLQAAGSTCTHQLH
jgi:hypothetical protein